VVVIGSPDRALELDPAHHRAVSAILPVEPQPPVGLYVHVPFCVSVCPYCDFAVVAGAATRGPRNRMDRFVAALLAELDLRADALDERFGPPRDETADDPPERGTADDVRPPERGTAGADDPPERAPTPSATRPPLRSAYLGGGTPSLLPADLLAEIVARIRTRYGLIPDAEVTLEANPGPDERGDAAAQRRAGVTRISLGAQSLVAGELPRLGRRHAPGDVVDAVAAARSVGIGSVNLDLMYDIPGQSLATWTESLERALELVPDHLSLYALTLDDPAAEGLTGPTGDHLPTSPGARRWRERARPVQDDDRAAAMYHLAVHRLGEAGLRGYELSNWARPGHESRHNLAYWERLPVEAVGPGAHAFDGAVRRWNAARLDRYVAALAPPDGSGGVSRLPPGASEPPLDAAAATAEALILGLRLDVGVPTSALLDPLFARSFTWASEAGLVEEIAHGRIRLTTSGRLLSNELFARLV
jgi:oxygen-independent coproporphyrinogen-3 oxidase